MKKIVFYAHFKNKGYGCREIKIIMLSKFFLITMLCLMITGCITTGTIQPQQDEPVKSLPSLTPEESNSISTNSPAPTATRQELATFSSLAATPSRAQTTVPQVRSEPEPLPFSGFGKFHVGKRKFTLEDSAREFREVSITLWYPAIPPADTTGNSTIPDADPDTDGAPYPLILSSTKVAGIFAPYLISYGFTWVSVDGIDTYPLMNEQMYEQPQDILFALDWIASNAPEDLTGVIDAGHAGVIGYSFDGYNTLAMSGARIDPEYYLNQCPVPNAVTKSILSGMSSYNCDPAFNWEEFSALAGKAITDSDDGLWQPMTDDRIRAVMPMAGEGWWLFGDRGLAAIDRPTLIIAGTRDTLYPENALIFEHIGTHEKTLISFVGPSHMMIFNDEEIAKMAHFATAFFSYYLQGREDYAKYFSEEFINQYDDLFWGIYKE